jgi:hypothetical protein
MKAFTAKTAEKTRLRRDMWKICGVYGGAYAAEKLALTDGFSPCFFAVLHAGKC